MRCGILIPPIRLGGRNLSLNSGHQGKSVKICSLTPIPVDLIAKLVLGSLISVSLISTIITTPDRGMSCGTVHNKLEPVYNHPPP
ncbi:MAG: hypothetical protein FJ385_04250 [Verrucomicrobia bacterium]|nr:hypothetical protein [Verrucomicrobiota bacterium]